MNTPVSAPLPSASGSRKTSVMAITSLIAGILGWSLLPFVGSVTAIITGHLARTEIKRSNGQLEGDGLAIGGLILGYAMVVLTIVSIIGAVLLFGGVAAFIAILANWG